MTLSKPKNKHFLKLLFANGALLALIINPRTIIARAQEFSPNLGQNQNTATVETTAGGDTAAATSTLDITLSEENLIDEPAPDKIVHAVITAYTSTPDQTDSTPCITADGTNLCKRGTEDVLAANWLPFGTKVKIPGLYGDRVFEIHDRMNRRYGYGRMDIWLNTTKTEAKKFGVKRVAVEIYYLKKDTKIAQAK